MYLVCVLSLLYAYIITTLCSHYNYYGHILYYLAEHYIIWRAHYTFFVQTIITLCYHFII